MEDSYGIEIGDDQEEWFAYFESHVEEEKNTVVYHDPIEGGPRVKVRNDQPFIEEALKRRKQIAENVYNAKTRSMEKVIGLVPMSIGDMFQENYDRYDFGIIALEGFKNKRTGEVIPCTRENKIALMKNEVFARFYNRCQRFLRGEKIEQDKAAEKNL